MSQNASGQRPSGLPNDEEAVVPGAQTERRGDAGPVRTLIGGRTAPADFTLLFYP
jgi:hypothetical protein